MSTDNESTADERPAHRVVVGIDGSSASQRALRVAADEARRRDATLEIVHAWSVPSVAYIAPFSVSGPIQYLVGEDADQEAKVVLSAAVDEVADEPDLAVRSSLIEGHPARVLVERARGADLLVVGRRGRGHLATILLGSTSRDCTEHAECPVLVVPVPAAADDPADSAPPQSGVGRPAETAEEGPAKPDLRVTPRGPMVLEEIAEEECLELLGRSGFGRVALVDKEHRPLIVPINFSLTPEGIAIRTDAGTSLEQGSQHRVALEVDDVNPSTHEGWSVLVRGNAFDVTDTLDDRSERLRATEVDTWAPGEKARRILIRISVVTGRRLRLLPTSSHEDSARAALVDPREPAHGTA